MKNCPNCNEEVPNSYDICWNCSFNFQSQQLEGFVSDNPKFNSDIVEPKELDCLRCKTPMIFEETIRLHEGSNWGILGDLGHIFTNRKSFDIYVCTTCYKIEFFVPTVTSR